MTLETLEIILNCDRSVWNLVIHLEFVSKSILNFFRMENLSVEHAIKQYCKKQNFNESFDVLIDPNESYLPEFEVDLEKLYVSYNERKNCGNSKLSFNYNLRKKEKSEKNDKKIEAEKKKIKKTRKTKEKIPESFLNLLDELCIDRNNAQKFFDNTDQWTFIKSDRKIFCTAKGKIWS
jgi:hypothetical protein